MSDSDGTTPPVTTTRALTMHEVERELGSAAAAQLAHVRLNLPNYTKQADDAAAAVDASKVEHDADPTRTVPVRVKDLRKLAGSLNLTNLVPRIEMPNLHQIAPQMDLTNLVPRIETPNLTDVMSNFTFDLDAAVPRIDLHAVSAIAKVAEELGQWYESFTARILPTINTLSAKVSSLLDVWKVLGNFGHRAARFGLDAALATREAVLHGEVEPLARFMENWLGIKSTGPGQEAVAAALLDDDWLDVSLDEVIPTIGRLQTRHRRNQRFITESQLNHFNVVRLETTVGRDPSGVTHKDVLLAPADSDPFEAEFSDPKLVWLLDRLSEMEVAIVSAKADGARTWADAAAECNAPLGRGEAVRRKVKRLSQQAQNSERRAS